MTTHDIARCAGVAVIASLLASTALDAQVAQGLSTSARAIAARTTTSAARAASALSSLGSGSSVAAGRMTSIVGYLWAGEGTPVSNATVQLRNLVTGQIEQVSSTLQNGAFAFTNVSSGTYAIEYVTETAGRVLAIGQAFSVAPGETVATFVRLGSNLVAIVPDLASNVAQATVSTAASAGVVTAVAPKQPASPLQ